MFDSALPISYYREIADLNREHGISIVQHVETGKIYLKKIMHVYNRPVYEHLYFNPVRNIPRIYAMYEEGDTLTLIEEYIPGDTLQEILDICGPLKPRDVAAHAIALCDILTALHTREQPVIHRDIKPSNVMLTEDDRIYLIDLNAARLMKQEKSRDTRLIGTEGFAAPEQFGFGESTPQTDIYAMGTLMTSLLTGDTDAKQLPDDKFGSIIRKCLEMSPKDRYRSAAQLRSYLARLKL